MTSANSDIFIGDQPLKHKRSSVTGQFVDFQGEKYYRISNSDQMPPFFMSLVSGSDHWLFVSSNGGLTAGRTNADSALFPYETEDKIFSHPDESGGKTLVRVTTNGRTYLWEPFSDRYAGVYAIERHLYKNEFGNKLIFEEVNHDLQLTIRSGWATGDRFGFVKSCWLQNNGDHNLQIDLLDGFVNLLPYGATNLLQNTMSNLLHAYKRSELEAETGLGIFGLSATLTDRAEPSESLKATVAWQVGLDADAYLLSGAQLDQFRHGAPVVCESEILGKPAAYLVQSAFDLAPHQTKAWHHVADVNQDKVAIQALLLVLKQDAEKITASVLADIGAGTAKLVELVASADGLQRSAAEPTTVHHFANVLFNIMRGGIFANGYTVDRSDLLDFVGTRNKSVLQTNQLWFDQLPETMTLDHLIQQANNTGNADLSRLCYEYLPLTFSRRHGDPSRPWNRFSINLKKEDGSANLDYQGNWRDIFQNWEPLALSFPGYAVSLIAKFLNATTADGYNPYRVTRSGIEWESPEPDNPWANIGYWSDHQIIYLQKLLEVADQMDAEALNRLWNRPIFAYANVPYRLKPYSDMLTDWYNTIDFDWESEKLAKAAVAAMGTDGRLMHDHNGHVLHVTMVEKLLVLLLAKLTNLVPDGGIWMNTQRPEWNDANNALVGKGLSVVTTGYLRRFIKFWHTKLAETQENFGVNSAIATLFAEVSATFSQFEPHLNSGFTDETRKAFMDTLGQTATRYRAAIYDYGVPQDQTIISRDELSNFLSCAQNYIDQTLQANRRTDHLAHTYNILRLEKDGVGVENLYLMLEGQVALLSSGALRPEEAIVLLENMRQSDLYRPDQHSYMLYPNRRLDNFQQKNNVPADKVSGSALVKGLTAAHDLSLITRDAADVYHFNGRFRNKNDVVAALDALAQDQTFAALVENERDFMLDLFEETFNHRAFTGRSGTFFAYEGLGSIYWHMVSKLLLAVQECYQQAVDQNLEPAIIQKLAELYYDVRSGIGFNKSPDVYGAFPTDPYSHTPMGGGARQPGMTGQVKEEILTRWGELGVKVTNGALGFFPTLLKPDEFLQAPADFEYVNMSGVAQTIALSPDALAFTFCQTPIVYQRGTGAEIETVLADGRSTTTAGSVLNSETSQRIFDRDGYVQLLRVTVPV